MDALLALAAPHELAALLHTILVLELAGMDECEADSLRRRTLGLIAFHQADDSAGVV